MSEAVLDLSDPLVREMAERNHQPEEVWAQSGELLSVQCRTCMNAWPCPTRVQLERRAPPR